MIVRYRYIMSLIWFVFAGWLNGYTQDLFDKDYIHTSNGTLEITFIGHASLMFFIDDYVIYIDPTHTVADYQNLPKADMILITHHHSDHCDPIAISELRKEDTKIITTEKGHERLNKGMIVYNDQTLNLDGFRIEVVPAYNIVHKKKNGELYHPKGEGNGYVITIGDKRIYIAGDTENVPEMKQLRYIDIAFLPMNQPYTMEPEMVADGINSFNPKIVYPYHHSGTNVKKLIELLGENSKTELRLRRMY